MGPVTDRVRLSQYLLVHDDPTVRSDLPVDELCDEVLRELSEVCSHHVTSLIITDEQSKEGLVLESLLDGPLSFQLAGYRITSIRVIACLVDFPKLMKHFGPTVIDLTIDCTSEDVYYNLDWDAFFDCLPESCPNLKKL